ncbi:uncharacterized protein LOC131598121 [Vicia villosa]|uniref:uncharacterized protein LOC131598121 n=1 Tax=Vicia villosa TaxID=3911 RepID=UPI00273CF0C3|nr:uncharacterized protein LOC131598121 [Vicia villosa]
MDTTIIERKRKSALARRHRRAVLNERTKKRNRVDENGSDFKICYSSFYHPLRDNVRIPLSNITSSISNIGIQNRRSPLGGVAKSSAKLLQIGLKESVSYSHMEKHSYENIVYHATPQPNMTDSQFSSESSISNITAVSLTPAQKSAMRITSVVSSSRKKKTHDVRTIAANLFNDFSNVANEGISSSTSNRVGTTEVDIEDDDSSDKSFSDSECEFINNNLDYDSASSVDDHEQENTIHSSINDHDSGYSDIGDPAIECTRCGALMWYGEKTYKRKHSAVPKFQQCCGNGKILLPLLKLPPPYLNQLLFQDDGPDNQNYQQYCRFYNMMFAFTSPGMKFDNRFNAGGGPPNIRVHGQPCHRIGSMVPLNGQTPRFSQLYIYDTENEIQHRIKGMGNNPNIIPHVVTELKNMLDEFNTHAKSFRMAADRLRHSDVPELKLRLIADRSKDGRIYNQPNVAEVAALIVGDVDTGDKRDIILERQSGKLKRISEFHPAYLALQYPLLFPYGEDGFRLGVLHRETSSKKKMNKLTIREWLAYRIQTRATEAHTLLRSRRLFQQFLVDEFCMMESQRLNYIRKHQKKLRVSKYSNLTGPDQGSDTQGSNKGKRVVLPSTYVGSRRYMEQLYFDGMAICSHVGFPELFITFTCNPKWPEIKRVTDKIKLHPHDRPDIISRVFKIKLDELLSDLTKKHVLGRVVAYIYTIEFQKRGLPHAHILLFMHPESKCPSPEDINNIISA